MLYTVIRKAVEQAIGLPMSASTERLLSTRLRNTMEELIEGDLSNQKIRMSRTAAGRRILHYIGWEHRMALRLMYSQTLGDKN